MHRNLKTFKILRNEISAEKLMGQVQENIGIFMKERSKKRQIICLDTRFYCKLKNRKLERFQSKSVRLKLQYFGSVKINE